MRMVDTDMDMDMGTREMKATSGIAGGQERP